MSAVKRRIEDWPEWVRPYLFKKRVVSVRRKKNSKEVANPAVSFCYSVRIVPYEVMLKNEASKSLKWRVSCVCKMCNEQFESNWNNMFLRKNERGKEICGRCCRAKHQYALGSDWRKNNSKSQKIAQGSVEARSRMSEKLKKVHRDCPDIAKKISASLKERYKSDESFREKISEASRRNWSDPAYRAKVSGNGWHKGVFLSRCGDVRFDSSWELIFLLWCDKNKDVKSFGRSKYRVSYKKPSGGIAYYYPDFDVNFFKDGDFVVEVKGSLQDLDLIERKRVAAENFFEDLNKTYVLMKKKEISRLSTFVGSKKVRDFIENLIEKGKVKNYQPAGRKHGKSKK